MKHEAILLKKYVAREYDPSVFEIGFVETPKIGNGEVLAKCLYSSVDPYMFSRIREDANYTKGIAIGEVMIAGGVGEVVETKNKNFSVGDYIESPNFGWQEYAKFGATQCRKIERSSLPIQTYLGACGLPGMTALIGLHQLNLPPKSTLIISSAAGSVGQLLGQLAKLKGIKVCGIAGSSEKVKFLLEDLKFDFAFNYHDKDWLKQMEAMGVPLATGFFDNVGGKLFEDLIKKMDIFGKILVCGTISQQQGPYQFDSSILRDFLIRRLTMIGFLVSDHASSFEAGLRELTELCINKKIFLKEQVSLGLKSAPDALLGLKTGSSFGKSIIKLF